MRQTAIWLSRVKSELGNAIEIDWRSFALEIVNSTKSVVWEAVASDPSYQSRGMTSLKAGRAARKQGEAEHWRFMLAILEAKHVNRLDIRSLRVVNEVARNSGLDMHVFNQDLESPDALIDIRRDHEEGVRLGVFGTPTFVFQGTDSVFLKMYTPPEAETLPVFEHFVGMVRNRNYFGELKRPQPPWPRGALE